MKLDTAPDPVAVAFNASREFISALDHAAAQHGETRSAFARRMLATLLRDAGLLAPEAPVTKHIAHRRALATRGQSR